MHKEGALVRPVNSITDVLRDVEMTANRYMTDFNHCDVGRIHIAASPMAFDRYTAGTQRPAPELGEDTNEVLAALGYTPEEISALHAAGTVR